MLCCMHTYQRAAFACTRVNLAWAVQSMDHIAEGHQLANVSAIIEAMDVVSGEVDL